MPQPEYYRLSVKAIQDETADARSFVLAPKQENIAQFKYVPGQFLNFRIPHQSGPILRSYSLSSAPGFDSDMTICVKRVDSGLASNWFNDQISVGARLEAQPPAGQFTIRSCDTPLLFIAGGSGITPCISLIKQALANTSRRVTILYANQHQNAIIYRKSLDQLKINYASRFECIHWLDDENGYLSNYDIAAIAQRCPKADSYICGPGALMDLAESTLESVYGKQAYIRTERFLSPDYIVDTPLPTLIENSISDPVKCRVQLDGAEHLLTLESGQTILQAMLAAQIDAPHSCTEGHCGACMAKLNEGEVNMASTKALSKRNIQRGYILTCQAHPSVETPLSIDFDL